MNSEYFLAGGLVGFLFVEVVALYVALSKYWQRTFTVWKIGSIISAAVFITGVILRLNGL